MDQQRFGIDKVMAVHTDGSAYDMCYKWLLLIRSMHELGATEMKAAAIILSMPNATYEDWRKEIAERLGVTYGYVSVIMNAMRNKQVIVNGKPNKKLILPEGRAVNVLLRIT